jgi:hypothetical protein
VCVGQFDGTDAVAGGDDVIPPPQQEQLDGVAQVGVVIDQEDGTDS